MYTLENAISINLTTSGRNTIPVIKPESIIQIHGKNGVGKSMAATLLEIASGNYLFPSESHFSKLQNVIELCNIKITVGKDREVFDIKITPPTWKFNRSLNKVHPQTVGTYYYNGKEIKFENFLKKVNIRAIRGDESLTQQISFFRDIFAGKINQKLEALENKIQLVENYKEWLSNKIIEKDLENYEEINEEYGKLITKKDDLINSKTSRELTLRQEKDQVQVLEKLLFISEHQDQDLKKIRPQLQEKLDSLQAEQELKIKEKMKLETQLTELTGKTDKETDDLIKKRDSFEKKLKKLGEQLKSLFTPEDLEKINRTTDMQTNIKYIQSQIDTQTQSQKRFKKELDDLNLRSQHVLEINGFLARLEEFCNQVQNETFAIDKFISIPKEHGEGEFKLSPRDLQSIVARSKQKFIENQQLTEYEHKVAQINAQIQQLNKQTDILTELAKIQNSLLGIEQKLSGLAGKIENYLDKDTQISSINERIQKKDGTIESYLSQITETQAKLNNIDQDLKSLSNLPSKNVLIANLAKLNLTLKNYSPETCSQRIEELKKDIGKNENSLEDFAKQLAPVDQEISEKKSAVEIFAEKIRNVGKVFGYSQLGAFIEYYKTHIQKVNKLAALLKNLLSKLQSLQKDLNSIITGRKPQNAKNGELIISEFDRIFKEVYDQPEFFKYVFKDYTSIKNFDIGERTIVFRTKTGIEEKRDLGEFSSGEKTYAYCRAIISMVAKSAEYCIVILDESYALLDHEHSQDLYEFQKAKIVDGSIAKFVNILPLKEDLTLVVDKLRADMNKEIKLGNEKDRANLQKQLEENETYLKEVNESGYYQKVVPV